MKSHDLAEEIVERAREELWLYDNDLQLD